ncbi:hypothetical protein [Mobiluncus porci]|uniref:Uncharacterized protein n=1 Tax=Mobiluncus porci TaxID=2652278 RepID=A0A7K0K5D2_9ACTO|nr:hypothetical protein [Mobiluncus porci]MST50687.1 hypothetical protein [Mobiluncus porci]
MDAVGLSNYAAAAGAATQAKTSVAPKTDAGVSGAPVSPLSTPFADSVELSTKPADTTKVAAFDPTAVDGSYEQKHIGGALATSSAKDGFDGWDYMLKNIFYIEEGGNRTDMPHIYKYNYSGQGPNSSGEGFVPANALSDSERNLIANMYVYAHDHGIDMRNGVSPMANLVWGIVNYAASGHQISPMNDAYAAGFNGAVGQAIDAQGSVTQANLIDDISGEVDEAVAAIGRGFHVTKNFLDQNPALVDEQVAATVEILSSSAMEDNLIPTGYLDNILVSNIGSKRSGAFFDDLKEVIYAYSKSASEGNLRVSETLSDKAQKVINWRENINDFWEAVNSKLETSGSESVKNDPLTDLFSQDKGKVEDNLKVFEKYSDRISFVLSSLDDDQKSTLGMMYKLAEDKHSDAALAKVDKMAGALAALNYMNKMNSDNDMPGMNGFWNQMLTRNQQETTKALQEAINKRLDAAKVSVGNSVSRTAETKPHIDTEA